jgi:hypothetical protein
MRSPGKLIKSVWYAQDWQGLSPGRAGIARRVVVRPGYWPGDEQGLYDARSG